MLILQYSMENILTDGCCLSLCTCKCCSALNTFDRLNFDGLARKYQKHQNFPLSVFCVTVAWQKFTIEYFRVKFVRGKIFSSLGVSN